MYLLLLVALVYSQSITHRYMFPVPVSGIQLIPLNKDSKFLSFSGRKSSNEYLEGLSIYTYDISSGTYHTSRDLSENSPSARALYGLFYVENEWIFLFGGIGPKGILGDMWRYDLSNFVWDQIFETSIVSPRFNFAYNTVQNETNKITQISIIGGSDETDEGLQDFYIFEIQNGTLTETHKMPSLDHGCVDLPIIGAQLQYINNNFYIFSGYHKYRSESSTYFTDLCEFDTHEKKWNKVQTKNSLIKSAQGGSFIYQNSIFYYFGKSYRGFNKDIYRLDLDDPENGWEKVDLERPHRCERSEFGYSSTIQDTNSNLFILFGHGITRDGYTNSLGFIDISSNSKLRVTCNLNIKNSLPRSKASMVQISDTLLLFGGTNSGTYFNDIWRSNYTGDINLYNWTLIEASGSYPNPRAGHSFASQGHFMLISGGRNERHALLSDYWLLDAANYNYRWTEILPLASSPRPPPLEYSCTILDIPYFYLIGGESNEFLSSDIWRFNLAENIFEKAKVKNDFPAVSRHGCFIDREKQKIYSLFGSKSLDNEPSQDIRSCDISKFPNVTCIKIIFKDPLAGRSNFGYTYIDSTLFIAGGQEYFVKSYADVWAVSFENFTTYKLPQIKAKKESEFNLKSGLHSMCSVSVGGQFFLYSGIEGNGETIEKESSDSIYKINLIMYPRFNTSCGDGSVSNGTNCLPCGKNSYKDSLSSRCRRCPVGTYSNVTGSTDIIQCTSCPYGYYLLSTYELVDCIKCSPGK